MSTRKVNRSQDAPIYTSGLHGKVVAVSGGFDPLHVGHLNLIREASALGDSLVVILNNDNWLRTKKRHIVMPEQERALILLALRWVNAVVISSHSLADPDRSVTRELRAIRPAIFANGGDRNKKTTPEDLVCAELGITAVYGVGGDDKKRSSSKIIEDAARAYRTST